MFNKEDNIKLTIKSQHNCFEVSAFPVPLKCNGGQNAPAHTAENHNQQLKPRQSLLTERLRPELDYITSSPGI